MLNLPDCSRVGGEIFGDYSPAFGIPVRKTVPIRHKDRLFSHPLGRKKTAILKGALFYVRLSSSAPFPRTDLALELAQPYLKSGKLPRGLRVHTRQHGAVEITCVQIDSLEAAQQLHKPCGKYITIQTPPLWNSLLDPQEEIDAAADSIRQMLPSHGGILVVGLGNSGVTPDALGPQVVRAHPGHPPPRRRACPADRPGLAAQNRRPSPPA